MKVERIGNTVYTTFTDGTVHTHRMGVGAVLWEWMNEQPLATCIITLFIVNSVIGLN